MNRILVSSDLTKRSLSAIKVAFSIGDKFDARVKVLHLHKGADNLGLTHLYPDFESRAYEMQEAYRSVFKQRLHDQISKLDNDFKTIDEEVLFIEDVNDFDEITEKFHADLVVLPKLNDEFDSFFGGALSERLIRVSKQDVLIAKTEQLNGTKSILVPIAINPFSASAIAKAILFAKAFDAKINLIHFHDVSGENIRFEQLPAAKDEPGALKDVQAAIENAKAEGVLEDVVLKFCKKEKKETLLEVIKNDNPDLVIMGTSRKRGLERLYLGSFCEYVLRNGISNLLIVKD